MCCTVQAQDVAWSDSRHEEWEAHCVALSDEVGASMKMDRQIMGRLGVEKGEEQANGVSD